MQQGSANVKLQVVKQISIRFVHSLSIGVTSFYHSMCEYGYIEILNESCKTISRFSYLKLYKLITLSTKLEHCCDQEEK